MNTNREALDDYLRQLRTPWAYKKAEAYLRLLLEEEQKRYPTGQKTGAIPSRPSAARPKEAGAKAGGGHPTPPAA